MHNQEKNICVSRNIKTETFAEVANEKLENIKELEKEKHLSNFDQFKKEIKNLRIMSENYLEISKHNFIAYVDNQKNHFNSYLTTIEDLLGIEAKDSEGEEAKKKMIEKKMAEFTREFNIVLCDLGKLKGN